MGKRIVFAALLLCLLAGCAATPAPTPQSAAAPDSAAPQTALPDPTPTQEMTAMQLLIGDTAFTVTLEANETAAALAQQLPLTLTMSELNGNEKYNYLPFSLPTDSRCPGRIEAGDVMLYGDSCLVVFYESFSTTYTYTPIGRITAPEGLAGAVGAGSVEMVFAPES